MARCSIADAASGLQRQWEQAIDGLALAKCPEKGRVVHMRQLKRINTNTAIVISMVLGVAAGLIGGEAMGQI